MTSHKTAKRARKRSRKSTTARVASGPSTPRMVGPFVCRGCTFATSHADTFAAHVREAHGSPEHPATWRS